LRFYKILSLPRAIVSLMSGAVGFVGVGVGVVALLLLLLGLSVRPVRELLLHPIEAFYVARFLLVGNKKQEAPKGSSKEQV
jgi:hypothetical protein